MKEGLSLKALILVPLLSTFYKNQNRTDAIKTVRRKQNLAENFLANLPDADEVTQPIKCD